MTTVSTGFLGKFGLEKATTWGTRVAPAANDQILIDRETLTAEVEMIEDGGFNGLAQQEQHIGGRTRLFGDIGGIYRYAGLDKILLCAFGTVSTWTVSTTNESYGDFTLQHSSSGDQFDSQFLSIDVDKGGGLGNNWQQFNSMAVNRFELEYNAGAPLRWSASLLGGGASGYAKGQSAPGSLSIFESHRSAITLGQHAKFFTLDTSNGDTTAMTNAHRFYPERFRIALDNRVREYVTSETDPYMAKPHRDGVPEFTGEIQMPLIETSGDYSDALEFLTDYEARTIKKMVVSFQYTSGSVDYAFNFIIPCYQFISKGNWDLTTKGLMAPTFGFRTVAHPGGLTPGNIWADATYFLTTLTAAQKEPWVNVQNNATAGP